jgi:hypothetical protein
MLFIQPLWKAVHRSSRTSMNAKSSFESNSVGYVNFVSKRLKNQVCISRCTLPLCRVSFLSRLDAFYGTEDVTLQNVDVMTDISMPATEFTRYTVAPTSVSQSSKLVSFTSLDFVLFTESCFRRSSRSKRKLERKVGSGRKGTVDEEEYLFKSVSKLVARINTVQGTSS